MIVDLVDFLGTIFVLIGTLFMLISAVGVIKMPDLYLRMSASTKTSTLGVACMLMGAVFFFLGEEEIGVITRTIAIIFFILLTAPVAAHLLGRAGYYNGVPLWDKTKYDDLEDKFDPKTQTVDSTIESSSGEQQTS